MSHGPSGMIATPAQLSDLVERIDAASRIGVDTEADSLHCYTEKVCLVQVGLASADELVDPLADVELSPLLEAFARKEIVLHGADFDLRMLYRLGLSAPGKVFDTMIAARLTGARKFGYSTLVEEHFGVTLPKGAQKANWAQRPLPAKVERYARNDTHYLLPLAELLERRLAELGRLEWLAQSCERAIEAARVVRERDPDTEWRVRGSGDLGRRASAVLRALWYWREDEARTADRPPFHILANEQLVSSARRFERGAEVSFSRLRGGRAARFRAAAEAALALEPSAWPPRPERKPRPKRPPSFDARFTALKRLRDRVADELSIEADLIAPRAALERLAADGEGAADALLPWQRELLRVDEL